jgi:hypothetical protein
VGVVVVFVKVGCFVELGCSVTLDLTVEEVVLVVLDLWVELAVLMGFVSESLVVVVGDLQNLVEV